MPRITRSTIDRIERAAESLGIPSDAAWVIRRASMTLHRWAEEECGDSNDHCSWCITRDDKGKPFREICSHSGGPNRMYPIRDMERGALRRLDRICAEHGLHYYHQTDPRGLAVYVSREPLNDSNYTHGVGIG